MRGVHRAALTWATLGAVVSLGMVGCDTGDGKSLAPPPPTETPSETTTTTVPATPDVTFLDGFGDLQVGGGEGAEAREVGFAVTLCRWEPDASADGERPALTVTGTGATGTGDRFALTAEAFTRPEAADLRADVDLSFASGPLWQATGSGANPASLRVQEQAQGLVITGQMDLAEIRPSGEVVPLGPASLEITCL